MRFVGLFRELTGEGGDPRLDQWVRTDPLHDGECVGIRQMEGYTDTIPPEDLQPPPDWGDELL
jgi:hypothetical protein